MRNTLVMFGRKHVINNGRNSTKSTTSKWEEEGEKDNWERWEEDGGGGTRTHSTMYE